MKLYSFYITPTYQVEFYFKLLKTKNAGILLRLGLPASIFSWRVPPQNVA